MNITIDSLTPVPIISETGNKQNKSIINLEPTVSDL